MLEPTDFSESSWTGPGMMEPLYPPAPPPPPTPAPMMDEPMASPRRKPAAKRKAARPKAKKRAAKKRPRAKAKRAGKAKRRKTARRPPREPPSTTPRGSVFRMVESSSARRSRATLWIPGSTEERDAWCVVRGDRGGLCGPALRRPAGRHPGHALPQRVRLESGRPRGLHERLRARLAHELRLRRPRRVRVAAAVRPLPEDVLRPRQVACLARVRGGSRPPARARPRALHGALQAAAARFRDGERADANLLE